jgi:hypothetical protein
LPRCSAITTKRSTRAEAEKNGGVALGEARPSAKRPSPGYPTCMEHDERQSPGEHDKEKAAKSEDLPKGPEQDETDSTFWDTDQHSDAPGPTGTG